jgi:hypothetical protein
VKALLTARGLQVQYASMTELTIEAGLALPKDASVEFALRSTQ